MQTRKSSALVRPRRAQHVEPRAVPVVDLEPEGAGVVDATGVAVEQRHLAGARLQHLRGDLADAPEADQEHRAACVGEVLFALLARLPRWRIRKRGAKA